MSGVLHGVLAAIAGGARGEQVYDIPGTYTWTVPAGVTSICVVCVGGGAGTASNVDGTGSSYHGGGGGGLVYKNSISVTPGTSYTVVVGSGAGPGSNGSASSMSGTGISISAGGGVVGSRSGAVSGGDVNNHGFCPQYTYASGGTIYWGSGGGASYTYDETNTTPYQSSGGIAAGSTIVAGVSYAASFGPNNPFFTSVSLDGGVGAVGAGGAIRNSTPPNGTPQTDVGYAGGVRIIWGAGRSYPNNAT